MKKFAKTFERTPAPVSLNLFGLSFHNEIYNTCPQSKLMSNKKIIKRRPKLLTFFMHNVEKWPHILWKFCGVHAGRFLKYIWLFFNIMHEMIKSFQVLNERSRGLSPLLVHLQFFTLLLHLWFSWNLFP